MFSLLIFLIKLYKKTDDAVCDNTGTNPQQSSQQLIIKNSVVLQQSPSLPVSQI